MIGNKYLISGMIMEVVAEEGDQWKLLNHTTGETVLLAKSFLEKSIRLGKAEQVLNE